MHIKISYFYCNECGNAFPVPRVKKQREKGHIKNLYCIKCKSRTHHTEVRDCDFILEQVI
jgi:NAD-dependent SIR2 family protein deacetylase